MRESVYAQLAVDLFEYLVNNPLALREDWERFDEISNIATAFGSCPACNYVGSIAGRCKTHCPIALTCDEFLDDPEHIFDGSLETRKIVLEGCKAWLADALKREAKHD